MNAPLNKATHSWVMSTKFLFPKVCWQSPAMCCLDSVDTSSKLSPIIWIFTGGDGTESRLPFNNIFYFTCPPCIYLDDAKLWAKKCVWSIHFIGLLFHKKVILKTKFAVLILMCNVQLWCHFYGLSPFLFQKNPTYCPCTAAYYI